MTKSKAKKYVKMDPVIDEYPMCCGIEVATEINLDEANHYDLNDSPEHVGTKEEVYTDFVKKVDKKRTKRHVQLCFVKKFKGKRGEHMPGFADFLKEKGWYEITTFLHPGHGNTLTVMGKNYRSMKKEPAYGSAFRYHW